MRQIQSEILHERGIEVNLSTIERCLNQQVKTTIKGMESGYTITWKYFGSFVATQKRVDMLNRTYIKKGKNPTLIDTGFHRMALSRKGDKIIAESIFDKTTIKDLIYRPND